MQELRLLLYPFSILYDGVTALRNLAFDQGWLSQQSFDVPVIAVGNLSTGGTGKTPMVEYLIHTYLPKKVAVLSRGYGRQTKGYILLNEDHSTDEVGDEPLQIKRKFGDAIISAVCEKRVDGIERLMNDHSPDLIILDDAYQHRYVKAAHYILLTSFNDLYVDDYVLPAGNLRESSRAAQRADQIVVTKCPPDLSEKEQVRIAHKLNPTADQDLYFATIAYEHYVQGVAGSLALDQLQGKEISVVTGIANPQPFLNHLNQFFVFKHFKFGDHHRFKEVEVDQIKKFDIVITTEKDYRRLETYQLPHLYYLSISTKFIGDNLVLEDLVV
ncbi:tetraacyldisaccharide 4'-kinase [Nonlabens xiamenensis]|uniref:tetraacyldisaccharide 4'-kinase n=1 Tax=Nonlabens xiamenensis TaxID=2341043 RepID=UPI000F60FAFF|nr:tetraacyldisaccharide 4'-kinase [Nonlabens xiamenensis]